jgi:HAD superfamily hydrolase (TIGR01509 family)
MARNQQWLLFDLGGVLMRFRGIDALADMTGLSTTRVHEMLLHSDAVQTFQQGRCTPEDFGIAMVDELALPIDPTALLHQWTEWEDGPMEGALELLDHLAQNSNIACLSNTNVLHWDRLTSRYGLDHRFFKRYVSHEIGLSKPDPRIFAHVTGDMGVLPADITYFDDNAEIVEAALTFGFNAHRVDGPDDIKAVLRLE